MNFILVEEDSDMARWKAGEAYIDLTATDTKLNNALKRSEGRMASFRKRMQGVATATKRIMLAGAIGLGATVKIASDVEEMESKFRAVFKRESNAVIEWAKVTGKAVNRSKLDLMEYAAGLQDTFVPLGFAREEATKLSKRLTTLGIDLSSFYNIAEKDTMNSLTSALVGNHEAVRRFGIVITEATLGQELFRMGIMGGTRAATNQQKVIARMNLIIRMTSDAQGDAARTSDSFQNRLKGLRGQLKETAAVLGKTLLPFLTKIVEKIKSVVERIGKWVAANEELAVSILKWTVVGGAGLILLPKLIHLGASMKIIWEGIGPPVTRAALAIGKFTVGAGALLPMLTGLAAVALLVPGFAYIKSQADAATEALKKLEAESLRLGKIADKMFGPKKKPELPPEPVVTPQAKKITEAEDKTRAFFLYQLEMKKQIASADKDEIKFAQKRYEMAYNNYLSSVARLGKVRELAKVEEAAAKEAASTRRVAQYHELRQQRLWKEREKRLKKETDLRKRLIPIQASIRAEEISQIDDPLKREIAGIVHAARLRRAAIRERGGDFAEEIAAEIRLENKQISGARKRHKVQFTGMQELYARLNRLRARLIKDPLKRELDLMNQRYDKEMKSLKKIGDEKKRQEALKVLGLARAAEAMEIERKFKEKPKAAAAPEFKSLTQVWRDVAKATFGGAAPGDKAQIETAKNTKNDLVESKKQTALLNKIEKTLGLATAPTPAVIPVA